MSRSSQKGRLRTEGLPLDFKVLLLDATSSVAGNILRGLVVLLGLAILLDILLLVLHLELGGLAGRGGLGGLAGLGAGGRGGRRLGLALVASASRDSGRDGATLGTLVQPSFLHGAPD